MLNPSKKAYTHSEYEHTNGKKEFSDMVRKFNIIIRKDEETGLYWGTCPVLKGCNTQGTTVGEVKENMKEAIELYQDSATN